MRQRELDTSQPIATSLGYLASSPTFPRAPLGEPVDHEEAVTQPQLAKKNVRLVVVAEEASLPIDYNPDLSEPRAAGPATAGIA